MDNAIVKRVIASVQAGNKDEARRTTTEHIAANPNDDDAWLLRAFANFTDKQWRAALRDATRVIEIFDGDWAVAHSEYATKILDLAFSMRSVCYLMQIVEVQGKARVLLLRRAEADIDNAILVSPQGSHSQELRAFLTKARKEASEEGDKLATWDLAERVARVIGRLIGGVIGGV